MKKNIDRYEIAPLKLVQRAGNEIPGIWDDIDYIRGCRGTLGLPLWPEQSFMYSLNPVERSSLCRRYGMNKEQTFAYGLALTSLAEWRVNKIVYYFDETLERELTKTEPTEIPQDMLNHLPYRSFYLKTSTFEVTIADRKVPIDGFLVNLSYDVTEHKEMLEITPCFDGCATAPTPITVFDMKLKGNPPKSKGENLFEQIMLGVFRGAEERRKVLQLILYIISQNADLLPENHKTETYEYREKTDGLTIKDKHREIKRWEVGSRIGPVLKRSVTEHKKASSSGSRNRSKRPHMRRAHWHHYWVGSRASEGRKLILKWLHPMMIGTLEDEDSPAVVCRVGS